MRKARDTADQGDGRRPSVSARSHARSKAVFARRCLAQPPRLLPGASRHRVVNLVPSHGAPSRSRPLRSGDRARRLWPRLRRRAPARPFHDVVSKGLEVLRRLSHRGAAGADPSTGDGAGILLQIPHAFYERVLSHRDVELPLAGDYGVVQCFLSRDAGADGRADGHRRGGRPLPQPEGHRLARRAGRRGRPRARRAEEPPSDEAALHRAHVRRRLPSSASSS